MIYLNFPICLYDNVHNSYLFDPFKIVIQHHIAYSVVKKYKQCPLLLFGFRVSKTLIVFQKTPTYFLFSFVSIYSFFQLIFAVIPPPGLLGGWPCFFVSLAMIGLIVIIVGDLAEIFGCLIDLKPEVLYSQITHN